jgi:hypothetical protein
VHIHIYILIVIFTLFFSEKYNVRLSRNLLEKGDVLVVSWCLLSMWMKCQNMP